MLTYYVISTIIAIIFGIIILKKVVEPIIEVSISFYFFVSVLMAIPFARLFLIGFLIKDYIEETKLWKK